eukprot:COSAG01_NODE_5354_length_4315_cov_18.225569_2_plen_102_part_00
MRRNATSGGKHASPLPSGTLHDGSGNRGGAGRGYLMPLHTALGHVSDSYTDDDDTRAFTVQLYSCRRSAVDRWHGRWSRTVIRTVVRPRVSRKYQEWVVNV